MLNIEIICRNLYYRSYQSFMSFQNMHTLLQNDLFLTSKTIKDA